MSVEKIEGENIFILSEEIDQVSVATLAKGLIEIETEELEANANEKNHTFKPISLYINSPGGDIVSAWAIVDLIESFSTPVRTICLGQCASAASLVFLSGTHRIMSEHSTVMIHNLSAVIPNYTAYKSICEYKDRLDDITKDILEFYKTHTKIPHKTIEEMVTDKKDHYLNINQCRKWGIVNDES